jgi:hypothetical protein
MTYYLLASPARLALIQLAPVSTRTRFRVIEKSWSRNQLQDP